MSPKMLASMPIHTTFLQLAPQLKPVRSLVVPTVQDSIAKCVPFDIDSCDAAHLFTVLSDNGVLAMQAIYFIVAMVLLADTLLFKDKDKK